MIESVYITVEGKPKVRVSTEKGIMYFNRFMMGVLKGFNSVDIVRGTYPGQITVVHGYNRKLKFQVKGKTSFVRVPQILRDQLGITENTVYGLERQLTNGIVLSPIKENNSEL